MTTQQINISFSSAMADTIRIHTGEIGRVIVFTPDILLEQDQSAEIIIVKPDNTFVIDDATISNGLIIVTIPEQAGAVSGVGGYILKVYKDSLCVYSASGPLMVDDHLLTDGMIESVAEAHGYVFPDDFLTDDDIEINPTSPAFATLTKIKYKGITYEVDGGAEDLDDLTDVTLTNPETGEVLTYDGQKWVNEALYIPDDLNDLIDVEITSPASGDVLQYNGQSWENNALDIPSDLDDLDDVEISAPSDGQQLVYNDGVWENQTITPVISKEATGNPIELTDAASAPMVKCVTQITGYQQGSGTPSPDNIRPITAYTEGEIEVRGKNLAPSSPISRGQYVDGAFQNNNNRICSDYINILPNVIYTASIDRSNTENLAFINYAYFDKNKTYLGDRTTNGESAFSGDKVHTFSVSNSQVAYIRLTIRAYSSPDLDISDKTLDNAQLMFEKGSTDTTYEPYTSTTHTTTYPSAIYRGSEDVVNGTASVEKVVIEFDGSSDEDWGVNTPAQDFYIIIPNSKRSTIICNAFKGVAPIRYDSLAVGECAFANAGDMYVNFHATHGDMATWKSYLASNPLQVVYEPNTPTTEQISPTNLPVKSLLGYNHIESSTGDMEVEYITKTYEPIIKSVEQLLPASTRSIQSTIAQAPQEIQKIVLEDEKEVGEEDAILRLTEEEGGEENADQRLTDE